MAVREPAGISTETPSSKAPARAALERHVLEADPLLERRQELGADVLVQLGLAFEELEDGRGRAVGQADRRRIASHSTIGRPGPASEASRISIAADRDAVGDQDVVAEQAERAGSRAAVEQAGRRVEPPPRSGSAGRRPRGTAPGARRTAACRRLDAVDPDRAEQPEVLVQQAELDRGVAQRPRRGLAGVAVAAPREVIQTSTPSETRNRVRIGEDQSARASRPTASTGIRGMTSRSAIRPSRTSLTSRVKMLTTGPIPSVGSDDWPSRYIWRWI